MNDSDTPGSRLRDFRKRQSISAETLATMVGISPSAVRNQENGTNGISATRAGQYASVLGCSAQWLLYGGGDATAARPPLPKPGISMTTDGKGNARLQIDTTIPFATALKVLALLEGGE